MAAEKDLVSSWRCSLDEGGRGRPALSAGPWGRNLSFFPASCPFLKALWLPRQPAALCMDRAGEEQACAGFPLSFRDEPGRRKALYKGFSDASIEKEGFNIRCWILSSTVRMSCSC